MVFKIKSLLSLLLIFAVLYFPVFNFFFDFLEKENLHNFNKHTKKPSFSWEKVWDLKYQDKFETWWLQKNNLYEYIIKTSNQINYSIFDQGPQGTDDQLYVGRNGALFANLQMRHARGERYRTDEEIKTLVKELESFHELLKSKGKELIIIIHPNKTELYPEWLGWDVDDNPQNKRDSEVMLPLLRKTDIPLIEVKDHLDKLDSSDTFYPKGGAHLNEYAQCIATKTLLDAVPKSINPGELSCERNYKLAHPSKEDKDLISLLNVWNADTSYEHTPKVKSSFKRSDVSPYNALLLSTSYGYGLARYINRNCVFSKLDMFFYNRVLITTKFKDQSCQKKSRSKRVFNDRFITKELVQNAKLVILEAPTQRITGLGNFLLDKFTEQLNQLE